MGTRQEGREEVVPKAQEQLAAHWDGPRAGAAKPQLCRDGACANSLCQGPGIWVQEEKTREYFFLAAAQGGGSAGPHGLSCLQVTHIPAPCLWGHWFPSQPLDPLVVKSRIHFSGEHFSFLPETVSAGLEALW